MFVLKISFKCWIGLSQLDLLFFEKAENTENSISIILALSLNEE